MYFISFSYDTKATCHHCRNEESRIKQKEKKKKADRTVGKPELLEQINDVIKQSGSFGLSGPPA